MEGLARKLKQIREREGLSQKDFARRLDINPVTMNRYEKGTQAPDVAALAKMRQVFGIDLNWLVCADDSHGGVEVPQTEIPVYDNRQVQLPAADRVATGYLPLLPGAIKGDYAYQVLDDGMTPRIFYGDYVIIDESAMECVPGDVWLIQFEENGRVEVRRLSHGDPSIGEAWKPDSPEYEMLLSARKVEMLGKVICLIRVRQF